MWELWVREQYRPKYGQRVRVVVLQDRWSPQARDTAASSRRIWEMSHVGEKKKGGKIDSGVVMIRCSLTAKGHKCVPIRELSAGLGTTNKPQNRSDWRKRPNGYCKSIRPHRSRSPRQRSMDRRRLKYKWSVCLQGNRMKAGV